MESTEELQIESKILACRGSFPACRGMSRPFSGQPAAREAPTLVIFEPTRLIGTKTTTEKDFFL
jgi:hypothetical protein